MKWKKKIRKFPKKQSVARSEGINVTKNKLKKINVRK